MTRVVDSRPRGGGVWRRRKCPEGHLSYTTQTPEVYIAGRKVKEKKKPEEVTKLLPSPLKPLPIALTKDSPLWLRSIARQLDCPNQA